MTPHLMLVTIGPIQEFIATARRSRDLWFGSWLLSELCKAATLTIVTGDGNRLIFPYPPDMQNDLQPGSDFNVANKIFAEIHQHPPDLAHNVKEAIQQRLTTIRDDAYAKIKTDKYLHWDTACTQIADLPEYYWVALPCDPQDAAQYGEIRQHLDMLMAARKNTRDFQAVPWSNRLVPKSSLDGQRESVIDEDAYPSRDDSTTQREAKITRLYNTYKAGPAERLSGVDLLKRHGNRAGEQRFFSTSHVAALPLLARMERTNQANGKRLQAQTDVCAYISALKDAGMPDDAFSQVPHKHPVFERHDGHLLFEERIDEYLRDAEKKQGQTAQRDEARRALSKFLRATVDGKRPLPYYALLLADGDHMGKTIDAQTTIEKHQDLSKQLAAFAKAVKGIVEKTHAGSLIYAGGDDVLALVPLHTVLACAQTLAETFADQMKGFLIIDGDKKYPTLSVGVAIAHHIDPMSDALTLARQAEKEAKKTRNALAITLSKRSGADRTIAGRWDAQIAERLQYFIDLHRREALPDSVAYDLHDMAVRLDQHVPIGAVRAEAQRIVQRKRTPQDQTRLDPTILDAFSRHFDRATDTRAIRDLAHEIIIARILADAHNLALEP